MKSKIAACCSPLVLPPCLQTDCCGVQTHQLSAGRRKENFVSFQPLLWQRLTQFDCLAIPFQWAKLERWEMQQLIQFPNCILKDISHFKELGSG